MKVSPKVGAWWTPYGVLRVRWGTLASSGFKARLRPVQLHNAFQFFVCTIGDGILVRTVLTSLRIMER